MIQHPLKDWRSAKKRPRSFVAEEIGCTPNTVYNWETYAAIPTGKAMAKLVELTGLAPGDFYPPVAAKPRRRA